MSFFGDIARFKTKSIAEADKYRRAVCLKLFSAVIQDTPVDTGRARASWNTSVRRTDSTVSDYDGGSKTIAAGLSISRIEGNLGKITDDVFLHNPVGYIGFLEYGTPKTEPRRMVRKNVKRIPSLMRGRR